MRPGETGVRIGKRGEVDTWEREHLLEVYVHSWHRKKPGTDTWTNELLLPCATRLSPTWSLLPEAISQERPGTRHLRSKKGME